MAFIGQPTLPFELISVSISTHCRGCDVSSPTHCRSGFCGLQAGAARVCDENTRGAGLARDLQGTGREHAGSLPANRPHPRFRRVRQNMCLGGHP
ncbi:hypothetical protein SAMN05428979_3297 [Stappia sp. ES.058]|nr:hypothetical protein SAMN05428979_3297 [Stappia sp. ES.058]